MNIKKIKSILNIHSSIKLTQNQTNILLDNFVDDTLICYRSVFVNINMTMIVWVFNNPVTIGSKRYRFTISVMGLDSSWVDESYLISFHETILDEIVLHSLIDKINLLPNIDQDNIYERISNELKFFISIEKIKEYLKDLNGKTLELIDYEVINNE